MDTNENTLAGWSDIIANSGKPHTVDTRLVDAIDFTRIVEPDYWQFKIWESSNGKKQHLYELSYPHLHNIEVKLERELRLAELEVKNNPALEWSLVAQAYIAARKGWLHAVRQELNHR